MSAYTPKMENALKDSAPHNYDTAQKFAEGHALPIRSVISKIKSMGLDYTPKPKAVSVGGPTIKKAELVESIRSSLKLPNRAGDFTKAELLVILENLG